MKKIILTKFLCFILHLSLLAQVGQNTTNGATALGYANATVAATEDPFWNNPAALGRVRYWGVAIAAQNRFATQPLTTVGLGGAWATNSGNFGVSIQNFGDQIYREQKLGFQYAKKLNSKLYLGVGFDWFRLQIRQYGTQNWVAIQLGAQFQWFEHLNLGILIQNPLPYRFNENIGTPTNFQVGATWRINQNVLFSGQITQNIADSWNGQLGIRYRILKKIVTQIGLIPRPIPIWSLGVDAAVHQDWTISVGASFQPILGFSSAFTCRRTLETDFLYQKPIEK